MLQYSTILPTTLELLKKLMQLPCLSDFNLGGGTALALQLGHRFSEDLDFFTSTDFDSEKVSYSLSKEFKFSILKMEENSLTIIVRNPEFSSSSVKLDLFKYNYPLISELIELDGLRLLSIRDIVPMKLSAIVSRGSKKDFYDLYFLMQRMSLKEMLILFNIRFLNFNHFHVVKSLTYFADADEETDPHVSTQIEWAEIKKNIQSAAKGLM